MTHFNSYSQTLRNVPLAVRLGGNFAAFRRLFHFSAGICSFVCSLMNLLRRFVPVSRRAGWLQGTGRLKINQTTFYTVYSGGEFKVQPCSFPPYLQVPPPWRSWWSHPDWRSPGTAQCSCVLASCAELFLHEEAASTWQKQGENTLI